jgi:D-glycero-alpha-D-manno-heptose 1-phosphate guanylyltransferase
MADCNEAVILAGGLGTRLRGVVDDVPKPLAPVAGRPFLAWVLDRLATQHIERVVLAIGYLGEQVEAVLGGEWNGMVLEYSREAAPLGTGGAIVLAGERVRGNDFFVVNGDTWLDLDYLEFDRCVASANARLGIALAKVPNVERYGAVRVEGGRVTGFIEKGTVGPGLINAGVYRVRRSLLDDCPRSTMFSFEQVVLVRAASYELVMGYTITEGFIDIGVPEDYRRAQTLFGPEPRG